MKIYILIALVLAAVGTAIFYQTNSPSLAYEKVSEEDAISLVSGYGDGRQFISDNPNYKVEATELDITAVKNLAREYPVIYGELPEKILYRVEYTSGGKGLLLIVDMERKEVMRSFGTIGIGLGG